MEAVNIGRSVTLLFDFNNLAIRSFFGVKEILEDPNDIQWGLWMYNVFNSIYQSMWKFKNVEEIILAVDDVNSWRKAVYNRYKEKRKDKKKESHIDWKELYTMMNKLANEFKHHMPFKVIKVKSSEADDVIGVLARTIDTPCVIIARDEDYFQCFNGKDNLRIYDPISQTLYAPRDIQGGDIEGFLQKIILCGQKKDDIPNILTPNDWGLTESTKGKRVPGFGDVAYGKIKDDIQGFLDRGYTNPKYGVVDLHANMKRNTILMDFRKIPNTIIDRIYNAYNRSHNLPPIENIYLFFEKYNMKAFMEDINKIENKMCSLY